MAVVIETTLGDFTIDLFTEERPQTSKNFLKLCKIKYYNFCLFHSVQANFLAQTGDPTGSGTGGESVFGVVHGDKARYYEAEKLPKLKHTKPGLLSMVNCGNNMLGSQFFLTLGSELQSLDEHCVFAEITEGMDILLKLNEAICDNQHRPYKDIRITHTVILEDPFEDLSGLVVPCASPEPSQLTLQNGRIGADEEIDETAGMTAAEIEEMKQSREAEARATILEIVGDLPDAEMAPPENVLFVCKLNPVTNDDDLEIIFSRFGKVKSCEVIRDHETGDSLQYAFIEFEEQRACEEAYFKMDNVLIDDRRIHVDFSQSVAKMRWRGKGRGVEYLDKNEKDKNHHSGESRSSSKRENNRDTRGENYRDTRNENHRENRDWSHRKRHDDERQRRRETNNEHQRTDKRKYDDCRKSDDRRRGQDKFKSREGNTQRLEHRKSHDRRDFHNISSSRSEDTRRRITDRKENDLRKNDSYCKDGRGKDKSNRSNSRNRSHSTEQLRDRNLNSRAKENGENGKSEWSRTVVSKSSRDKLEKEDSLNLSFTASSDIVDSKISDEPEIAKTEAEKDSKPKSSTKLEIESSSKETSNLRESSILSEKKLKRKQKSDESKSRKKRKTSTSSDSSSAASDSSMSSSSSESASSDYKRKHKRHKTIAKKYYHRGKLVKVVKKKRDSSESESFSDSSSESDSRRRKKKKGRKKHTKKIVKIIEKRRFSSSNESGSDSSSSSDDSENDRSKKKKRKKLSDKRKKKKKKSNPVKKHKKTKNSDSSDSESEEKTSVNKTKKHKKESITTQTSD